MTTKVVTFLKYVGFFSIVFFSIVSCDKEIESIGVDIIDNNKFSIGDFVAETTTSTQNVERVPANGLPQYLLGVYSDPEFGALKGSIVSQIIPSKIGDNYNYGDNAAIDSVLIYIPYQVTAQDDAEDGKPVFEIDSIIGNTNQEFKLSVYELETFLNTLDPTDPSKPMVYYSDKVFQKSSTPLFAENFKVNPNDTVAYIKRYMPDGITVYDTDTIKEAGLTPTPTIKLPLNEAMIQQLFVDNASGSEFSSVEEFIRYFRGFYLEATATNSNESHLISLSMANSKMTIYYSNDEEEAEDEDKDGDGVTGEGVVRVKQSYDFNFGTTRSNVLERDNSDIQQSGPNRLYVQGAAGSVATIDLFEGQNLPEIRENMYLITGATLTFYVDQNASSDIAPGRLFIYNYEDNEQILDMITEGIATVGASLEYDEDGKPYKYVFSITDYISQVLLSENPDELVTIGVKVYNPTDSPTSSSDTSVKEYSWTPKGVVLYNQSQEFEDKRVKLDIYYSKINN